jgi:hypothetical protein
MDKENIVLEFLNGGTIKLTIERNEEIAKAFIDYSNSNPIKGLKAFNVYRVTEMKGGAYTEASFQIFVLNRKGGVMSVYSYVEGKIEPGDGIPAEYYGENSPLLRKPN